jgi:ABC-type multidrug transport system ATPase subunit
LILLTTHELSFIRQIATRFAILHHGRIAAEFPNAGVSLDTLQEQYSAALGAEKKPQMEQL